MAIYEYRTVKTKGTVTLEDSYLGRGGEGSVFAVQNVSDSGLPSASSLVAKVYHDPTAGNRKEKVEAMLKSVPETDSVAWPLATLYSTSGSFQGYLMTKLDTKKYKTWAELSNTSKRKKVSPKFDVRYAVTACMNLAIALDSVHRAGHCVGDVNESNIMVASDARVMIVDTDSAQVKDPSGKIFHCPVGKPEYTAPELTKGKLSEMTRTPSTDMFAYCMAAYQMLSGGASPTNSVYKGEGDPPTIVEKIRNGWYPGILPCPETMSPPPRVPVKAIPLVFMNVFKKGLLNDPSKRPSFESVINAENGVAVNLVSCSKEPLHWYDKRQNTCPWCAHKKTGQPDPWSELVPQTKSSPSRKQTSLEPVDFESSQNNSSVKRVPIAQPPEPAPAVNQGVHSPRKKNSPLSTPAQVPSPPPTPKKEAPKKIKGKSVVYYGDGSYGPRPDLRVVSKQLGFKTAASMWLDEIPSLMKCWWYAERSPASILGLLLALILGLGMSALYATIGMNYLMTLLSSDYWTVSVRLFCYTSAGFSVLSTLYLFVSGLLDVKRHKGYNSGKKEFPILTAANGMIQSIFWGPLLIVGALGTLILQIFRKK